MEHFDYDNTKGLMLNGVCPVCSNIVNIIPSGHAEVIKSTVYRFFKMIPYKKNKKTVTRYWKMFCPSCKIQFDITED